MKHAWLFAALALAAACATPERDPHEQGARLIAELRQASGGGGLEAPNGFHETGVIALAGHTSTYETWGDFRALRWSGTRTTDGQTLATGFDGQTAWRVGADGVVHTDTSATGLAGARLSTYLTIAAYLYPDRFPATFEYKGRQSADGASYDVVTVTPRDSVPIDMWLDLRTHLLQRLSGMDGQTPFVGVVQRYQVVDGIQIPYEIRQTLGGREMAQTLRSYQFVDVPADRFSAPAAH